MLSVVNIKFGNNNNNKVKKIYNKGDIILVRPQNMRYPYKIISVKEKKIKIAENIKIAKTQNQNKLFTLNDICSISNFGNPSPMNNTNQINNSIGKDNFIIRNSNKLKKYNSEIAIRKKIIEIEKQKEINNNKENIRQRNFDDNFFLKKKGLSYNNSKFADNFFKNNNKNLKININSDNKEETLKFFYYDSTLINNEKNKKCYRLKYDQLTSGIIRSDCNEKNLIFKRNFDNIKNIKQIKNRNDGMLKVKGMKAFKSNKDIKLRRQKSTKIEGIKSHEKITIKTKRPYSTDNRKRHQRINFELKIANKKYKLEENKNFLEKDNKFRKEKKKFKIQKELKMMESNNGFLNYLNEVNKGFQQNVIKLNKFIELKSRKNSDIFDYIVLPHKSEDIYSNKTNYKDFTEFKSMISE